MNRILVIYGGRDYTVGNRSLEEVQDEITRGLESGGPTWLDVNFGEGKPLPCRLLLTPGVTISVVGFPSSAASNVDEASD